jgi:hypothetical protein
MSESAKRFSELESEFGHDFDTLSHRLSEVYAGLDGKAHANGSTHSDNEILYIDTKPDDVVMAVFCEKDTQGRMHVRTQNAEGTPVTEYICNVMVETPKHRTQVEGGKHLAGGPVVPGQSAQPELSQTDTMLAMIGILETCYRELKTQKNLAIIAYEK